MKIIKIEYLVEKGSFVKSETFNKVLTILKHRIRSMKLNSDSEFIINPTKMGNGVKPISHLFCSQLPEGWKGQDKFDIMEGKKPGPIDVVINTDYGRFAIEWETGNISSSHRALNKLSIGLIQKKIICGILIVPTRKFYYYLTDRVGNFEELEPYFPLYRSLNIPEGVLAVIAIEHDGVLVGSPFTGKGKDGNAKKITGVIEYNKQFKK